MHGNEADLALVPRIAERLDDANLRHPIAVCAREFEADEVALLGRADVIGGDRPLPQLWARDGVDDAGAASRVRGIFRSKAGGGGIVDPIDRKELREWPVASDDVGTAKEGDLVRFELARAHRYGVPQVRIVETLGNPGDQRKISLIAVHAHGIPDEFPAGVLGEVRALEPPSCAGRADLRGLSLVTIDPEDARDHDDAVHAAPDADPGNKGGFVVHVAIADVAHYVRPGSRLDREAQL